LATSGRVCFAAYERKRDGHTGRKARVHP
jgi:hypothetical protein